MPPLVTSPSRPARGPAIAATLAVHLLLAGLWFGAQSPRPRVQRDGPRIQWINLPLPTQARPPAAQATRNGATQAAAPAPLVLVPSAPSAPPAPAAASTQPAADATQAGADVLAQARRDIGKIAIELGKEKPGLLHAPLNTAQTRLAAGIDKATRAPHLFEAPKVELVQDQGGYDRRIYKVKGALGTYCITVESNHAPDGLDAMKRGIQQKITTCPREE